MQWRPWAGGHQGITHMAHTNKNWLLLLVSLAILGLSGCGQTSSGSDGTTDDEASSEETQDEEEALPTPVEVATVTIGDIQAIYSGTASLEADGEATVMAKVGGEILELLVQEGDAVDAGQVVARLDDARLRLEVMRSKANLDKARQEYQRNIELHEKGLLPAGTFEGLKFDLDALKAAHELARLELSYTSVKAPIAGTISERLVKAGNTIAANTGVFQITDLDPLLAYLYVPERDFQKLAKGQPVRMTVDAIPDTVFEGEIQLISPVIDPETGTFKVTAAVKDNSGRLAPGMFGRVSIIYDTRYEVPLVPRVALLDTNNEASVFVIENELAQRRQVTTGYASGPNVEVLSGLSAGDRVVVIGQSGLKQDAKVQVIEPGASVARIRPKSEDDDD